MEVKTTTFIKNFVLKFVFMKLKHFCRALVRSVFKSMFSLFCPLVIFFFTLYRGQTKYDRVFRCSVVDSRSLFRPVHAGQGQGSNQPRLVQVG